MILYQQIAMEKNKQGWGNTITALPPLKRKGKSTVRGGPKGKERKANIGISPLVLNILIFCL